MVEVVLKGQLENCVKSSFSCNILEYDTSSWTVKVFSSIGRTMKAAIEEERHAGPGDSFLDINWKANVSLMAGIICYSTQTTILSNNRVEHILETLLAWKETHSTMLTELQILYCLISLSQELSMQHKKVANKLQIHLSSHNVYLPLEIVSL